MTVKEGAVVIANITVAMGAYYLHKFERVLLFSGLGHALYEFLQILVVIVGRVNFIDLCLNHGELIVLLSEGAPRGVVAGLLHEGFDLSHLFFGLDGVLNLLAVVFDDVFHYCKLVVDLLCHCFP